MNEFETAKAVIEEGIAFMTSVQTITISNDIGSRAVRLLKYDRDSGAYAHLRDIPPKTQGSSNDIVESFDVGTTLAFGPSGDAVIWDHFHVLPGEFVFEESRSKNGDAQGYWLNRASDGGWTWNAEPESPDHIVRRFRTLEASLDRLLLYSPEDDADRLIEIPFSIEAKAALESEEQEPNDLTYDFTLGDVLIQTASGAKLEGVCHAGVRNSYAIKINLLRLPLREARSQMKHVPNTDANLCGWDPAMIFVADSEAMQRAIRQPIFESLDERHTDYETIGGDYAVKAGLTYVPIDSGGRSEKAEMVYSREELLGSVNVGVDVQVGDVTADTPSDFQGGIKAEYTHSWGNTSETSTYRAINRQEEEIYRIRTDPVILPFSKTFLEDIDRLPVIDAINAADVPEIVAYRKFVEKYGTHYPTSVGYGGCFLAGAAVDSALVNTFRSHGAQVEVNAGARAGSYPVVVKVNAGGEGSQDTTNKKVADSFTSSHNGGSSPDGRSFEVDSSSVQPMKFVLRPIDELLSEHVFRTSPHMKKLPERAEVLRGIIREKLEKDSDSVLEDLTYAPHYKIYECQVLSITDTHHESRRIFGRIAIDRNTDISDALDQKMMPDKFKGYLDGTKSGKTEFNDHRKTLAVFSRDKKGFGPIHADTNYGKFGSDVTPLDSLVHKSSTVRFIWQGQPDETADVDFWIHVDLVQANAQGPSLMRFVQWNNSSHDERIHIVCPGTYDGWRTETKSSNDLTLTYRYRVLPKYMVPPDLPFFLQGRW
jgi:hypothetical protein